MELMEVVVSNNKPEYSEKAVVDNRSSVLVVAVTVLAEAAAMHKLSVVHTDFHKHHTLYTLSVP